MADIKYEIIEKIKVLSENSNGWTKELNIISWNNSKPKYDIREWSENRERMSKGITLTEEEMQILVEAIKNR